MNGTGLSENTKGTSLNIKLDVLLDALFDAMFGAVRDGN